MELRRGSHRFPKPVNGENVDKNISFFLSKRMSKTVVLDRSEVFVRLCQTWLMTFLGGKFWWWRHYIKFLFDPRWIGDRSEFLAMGEPPMEKTPRKIGRNIGYDSIQRITNDISVFLVGVFIRNTYIWWFTLWMTFSMFFFAWQVNFGGQNSRWLKIQKHFWEGFTRRKVYPANSCLLHILQDFSVRGVKVPTIFILDDLCLE